MPQRITPRSAYPRGVRRGDRSSADPFARYSAWTCSNASVSISASWTGFLDQIHWPGSLRFCLMVWPSATSLTSMSSSDLGCLFQTCRPV